MPGGNYDVPPQVSYGYGLGDNTKPTGPAPNYSFKYGIGDNAAPSTTANYSYGYGADGMTSDSVGMSKPSPQQQVAAPATGHPATNANHI